MKKKQELYFQKKMFGLISAFLLTLFATLSIIISIYAYQNSIASSAALQEETVESCAQKLEQMIRDMDAISVQLASNSTIQNIFQDIALLEDHENYFENNAQARKNVEVECSSINMAPNMVDAIYIFREPYDFFSYNTERYDKVQVLQFLESEEIGQYKEYPNGYYRVLVPHINPWISEDERKVISLVRPLIATYYSREEVATLEVQYRYSRLQRICGQENTINHIQMLVLDNTTGKRIYPEELSDVTGLSEMPGISGGKVQIVKNDAGQKFAAYRYNLESCDWSIFGVQEYGQYMKSTWVILSLIAVLCIGFSMLTLTGVFLVTRQLTLPIRNLRAALGTITLDNVTITSDYEGNNEIELLQERFQQVLTALQQSAKQITIAQTAEYQARIEALQAQINPHFLYNSLMSISAAGQERDALKIQNMCSQLSDIFRYASSGGSEAALGEELDNVENYLAFMKFRYLENLNFSLERCKSIENISVPKLILQPVIENCFRHGFYMVEPPFFVKIVCGMRGEHWYVEVTDNGGGFPEEKLQEIFELQKKIDDDFMNKSYGRKMATQNMALLNVYARLKVRYQDNTVFIIQNIAERGAVVHIGGELDGKKFK